MKKPFVLALALTSLTFAFGAASCARETGERQFEIVLVAKIEGVPWFDSTREGITAFSNARPTVNAHQIAHFTADPAAQVALVNDLIAAGVDAIIVIPNDPASLVPAFANARAQGIVVVVHEGPGQAEADFVLEAFENHAYGAHMMDIMANWMGGEGLWQPFVGLLTSPTHNQWIDGGLMRAQENWPGVVAAGGRLEDEEDQLLAYQRTQELLLANPNIRGIMGSAGSTVPGAALAITEAGLVGQVAAFGTSLPSVAGVHLESGAAQSIHFWVPADAAYVSAVIAYRLLRGEPIYEGMDLGRPGYNSVTIRNNEHGVPVVYGQAWVDVNRDNLHEWRNPDGSYRL